MKRAVLIYGSILGVLLSINLICMVYLCYAEPDFMPSMWLGYLVILVMLSTVFFGIKSYRDKQLNGIISLGRAFKTGAFIAFVGATGTSACLNFAGQKIWVFKSKLNN